MRNTFKQFADFFEDKNLNHEFQMQVQKNYFNSKLYYTLVLLIVLPFLIMQIRGFLLNGIGIFYTGEEISRYGGEHLYWAIALDIFDNFLNYASYYLLAIILWTIINISWALESINSEIYIKNAKINLFKADNMGGLRPLRSLIISFSVYYFVIIILFVMSWVYPDPICSPYPCGYKLDLYESKFLLMFWIIGVIFFIWGWYAIRKFLSRKLEDEINSISDLCRCKTQQLSDLISKDDSNEIEKRLNQISEALDVLHKERERILRLGAKPMDIKSILLFLISSLPSLIAIVKTLNDVREIHIIDIIINNTMDIVNQSINYLFT